MASIFNLKALGLSTQINQLETPPGSLSIANNVNITRTDVIEPRRGFQLYGDSFGSISDVAKQLFSYKFRILRHFNETLQFDNGSGTFTDFDTTFIEAQAGLRTKSAEMNGNLYLTSSEGIRVISANDPAGLSSAPGVVYNAGAPPGLDMTGVVNYFYGNDTGFLTEDSAVNYAVLWNYNDNNDNLIQGVPSESVSVYAYFLNLLIPDYMQLLSALDNIGALGSAINAQNYVTEFGLPSTANATDLYNELIALTSALDTNLTYVNNYTNLGAWDASTNTPTLHNNPLVVNDTYIVSVAGTQDLGNGPVAYSVNDVLVYDGYDWSVNDADSGTNDGYTYIGTYDPTFVNLGTFDASTNNAGIVDGIGTLNNYYIVNNAGTLNLSDNSGNQYYNLGNWSASSNTPTLANGTGPSLPSGFQFGYYTSTTAGTVNFGAGPITFAIGDQVYYNTNSSINEWMKPTNAIQAFTVGEQVYYNGTIWTNYPTPIINLVNGQGTAGSLYLITAAGSHDFGAGPIAFAANDFVSYNGLTWNLVTNLNYLGMWDASTNTPTIYPTTVVNGDYYTVSVAGTQDLGTGPTAYTVGQIIVYTDGIWTLNAGPIPAAGPLVPSSAIIANGVATITFSSGNPSLYMAAGDVIALTGFNIANVTPGINVVTTTTPITNTQTVVSVSNTALTFNTTVTGLVDIAPGATITSFAFSSIAQPTAPAIPATDQDLLNLQNYIVQIIAQLNAEPTTVISAPLAAEYIAPLTVTTSADVTLTFTIPQGVTTSNFFQLYRSITFSATGTSVLGETVIPNDELQLVYEAFPTAAQIAAGQVVYTDNTPDSFLGAFLYTNAISGQGAEQANDNPPFALDINVYKGSMFYANTQTAQTLDIQLLGVSQMITDYENGIIPSITISTPTGFETYHFVLGTSETFTITTNAGSTLATTGTGSYFDVNSGGNVNLYRFWYYNGTTTAPTAAGRLLVPILFSNSDNADEIAQETTNAINLYPQDNTATISGNVVTVTATTQGITTAPSAGTSGFTFAVTVVGNGQNAATNQVLLSNNVSPAIAIQLTAQSLASIINQNSGTDVYAYYTSGIQEVPGQITLESTTVAGAQFFVTTNNNNTGISFSPSLAPALTISSIVANSSTTALVTTTTPTGLTNLEFVYISGSNSVPNIDGYQQITYVSANSFLVNIPSAITIPGTQGGVTVASSASSSSQNGYANRIFYSKLQQPEAVPLLNFFDVGARDKAILRIFPLRDSLFVLKEDGVYRISGEAIPFNLALFDSSCILVSPDSVSTVNNQVFGWARQGIVAVTESGIQNMSRPIDVDILPLSSVSYTNFPTATWGIGYESDKSYTVFTLQETTDTIAVLGYKFNTLTSAWTIIDKNSVCGVINFLDDRMYLGAGDTNFIEQERKSYDRTDFADRQYDVNIMPNSSGTSLVLNTVANVAVDDVIVQVQPVSIYTFNALLNMLDTDPGINNKTFLADLQALPEDNLQTDLTALANKLDVSGLEFTNYAASIGDLSGSITAISVGEPTTITSPTNGLITGRVVLISGSNSIPSINGTYSVTVIDANHFTIDPGFLVTTAGTTGTFETQTQDFNDLLTSFNQIVALLNSDDKVTFKNYQQSTNPANEEILITAVNVNTNTITISQPLPFIQGAAIVYNGIDCSVVYSPYTFGGDPISLKQISEAQIMFDNRAFTNCTVSFATDLLPEFQPVIFNGDGPGLFGISNNFGGGFFGGASNSAPFRTLIPRFCQRCRYMVVMFEHNIAREKWALNGITLSGNTQLSTRAYR